MENILFQIAQLVGVSATFAGACITAKAVILTPEQALHIGLARYSSGNPEKDLQLPVVQNRLRASRNAKCGLVWIAAGALVQLLSIIGPFLAPSFT